MRMPRAANQEPRKRRRTEHSWRMGLMAFIVFTAVFGATAASADEVKTSRGEITIPTYPWGPDDINPFFRWVSPGGYSPTLTIYPYPMQDNLSQKKIDKTYKTLVVENKYLKVIVIPELGGHVHSVIDKMTGEGMLYENKVIKASLIGLRGAWGSGGVEFNTGPQGHTVTCLSPVEATFVDYPDGGKAIAVGNVEQVYHTQWVVTVRLRPDRAFMEEHVRIYNPTGNRHIYYFWNCVAMPNTPTTQFIYPMTLGSDHGGTSFFTWPRHEGKDISMLKNFDQPTSVFAYRCDQDFYGSYDHATDRGVLTYADHHELIGKKSWTWSLSPWGLLAQEGLTDDGTHYNEIQTGPMQTQADYGALEPRQTVEWDEWWFPVRGTKGVTFANKDVTANVVRGEGGTVTINLHGTGTWDAVCSIFGNGEQKVRITPEKAVSLTFTLKQTVEPRPYEVKITAGKETLAKFTAPLQIPARTPPEKPRELPPETTVYGMWARGIHHDKEGGAHLAREWYGKALKTDPDYVPALISLGELELDAGRWEEARDRLARALKLEPDNGWCSYYLAQAWRELGRVDEAMEALTVAIRRPESTGPAYALLGILHCHKGDFARAPDAMRKALAVNPGDLAARDFYAWLLWRNGDAEEAKRQLKEVLNRDPLDMAAGALGELIVGDNAEFAERVRGRRDEVLDLADFFITAGLPTEAVWSLNRYYLDPSIKRRETDPMPWYYAGVLANDDKSLDAAAQLGPDYVFPNRRSEFKILQEVVKRRPKDWKARHYLGNLCMERCRKEDAVRLWSEALAAGGDYSVTHRNLGLIAWKIDNSVWKAIGHYENALKANPNDVPIARDLGRLYESVGEHARVRDLLEAVRKKGCARADVTMMLGWAWHRTGEDGKALELLMAASYNNWEGQSGLYDLYTAVRLSRGEHLFRKGDYAGALTEFEASMTFPRTLGAGKLSESSRAETDWWIGMTLEKMNKAGEAKTAFERAAKAVESGSERSRNFARLAAERLKSGVTK